MSVSETGSPSVIQSAVTPLPPLPRADSGVERLPERGLHDVAWRVSGYHRITHNDIWVQRHRTDCRLNEQPRSGSQTLGVPVVPFTGYPLCPRRGVRDDAQRGRSRPCRTTRPSRVSQRRRTRRRLRGAPSPSVPSTGRSSTSAPRSTDSTGPSTTADRWYSPFRRPDRRPPATITAGRTRTGTEVSSPPTGEPAAAQQFQYSMPRYGPINSVSDSIQEPFVDRHGRLSARLSDRDARDWASSRPRRDAARRRLVSRRAELSLPAASGP